MSSLAPASRARSRPQLVAALVATWLLCSCPAHGATPESDSLTVVAARVVPESGPGGLARADRLQHASLAFASGLALGLVTDEPAAAAGGAFTLGLAKEYFDRSGSGFDRVDLLADTLGAALAAWATLALSR